MEPFKPLNNKLDQEAYSKMLTRINGFFTDGDNIFNDFTKLFPNISSNDLKNLSEFIKSIFLQHDGLFKNTSASDLKGFLIKLNADKEGVENYYSKMGLWTPPIISFDSESDIIRIVVSQHQDKDVVKKDDIPENKNDAPLKGQLAVDISNYVSLFEQQDFSLGNTLNLYLIYIFTRILREIYGGSIVGVVNTEIVTLPFLTAAVTVKFLKKLGKFSEAFRALNHNVPDAGNTVTYILTPTFKIKFETSSLLNLMQSYALASAFRLLTVDEYAKLILIKPKIDNRSKPIEGIEG